MLLSDKDIKEAYNKGYIGIEPYEPELVQPSTVDVRLDRYYRIFNSHKYPFIDPAIEQLELTELHEEETWLIHPGQFMLASTFERWSLGSSHAAALMGKSSLGRLGLEVHATAGWIDSGFNDYITLELSNVCNLPIRLYAGMKIAQIAIYKLSSPVENVYGNKILESHYHQSNGRGPTPARIYKNFKIWDTGEDVYQ